jgi:hypothetical protein
MRHQEIAPGTQAGQGVQLGQHRFLAATMVAFWYSMTAQR